MAGERIVWVDTVRTVAIFLIVLFHVSYEFTSDQNLRSIGYVGDSLFFIISGFMLAQRYPEIKKLDPRWFLRRYVKIASLYYPTLIAVALLFFIGQDFIKTVYDLILHFLFLNWVSPDYLYGLISPAWFVIPLVFFYILFPYLNRLLASSKYILLLIFLITAADRFFEGGWASHMPLFFLADFCLGIAFAQYKQDKNNKAGIFLLSPLVTAVISPIMIIPYVLFYLLSMLENYNLGLFGVFSFIGRYTFEIFLFHESIMKVLLGKWNIYGLPVLQSFIVLIVSFAIVEKLSIEFQHRLLPKVNG